MRTGISVPIWQPPPRNVSVWSNLWPHNMINCTNTHTNPPTTHLQGVLAERGLEAEGGPWTFSSHQAVTQHNLINLCFWRYPLHKRDSVWHISHNQLCGAINHCKTKKESSIIIECPVAVDIDKQRRKGVVTLSTFFILRHHRLNFLVLFAIFIAYWTPTLWIFTKK